MTILVTGAAGYLGNQTVKRLAAEGRSVRALVRHKAKAAIRLKAVADQIELVEGDVTRPGSLTPAMKDVTTVIHYVAIAMEKGGQTYEAVNYQGTVNLLKAAEAAGVQRFINMSQNGARSDLPYRFLASKGMAQEAVAASDLRWTALRPSAIFGPQDEFFNSFRPSAQSHAAGLSFDWRRPKALNFSRCRSIDVVEAVLRCLDDDSTIGEGTGAGRARSLDAGRNRKAHHRGDEYLAASCCRCRSRCLRPPVMLMQALLPGSPVSTSLLELLALPNTVPDNALVNHFGMTPIPFAGETYRLS